MNENCPYPHWGNDDECRFCPKTPWSAVPVTDGRREATRSPDSPLPADPALALAMLGFAVREGDER
jgi:hypothetical protein